MESEEVLRDIKHKLKEFFKEENKKLQSFNPGEDSVTIGWPIYDENEVISVINALLEFRLSSGPYVKEFESKFSQYQGSKLATAVNSGTSANILAINTLLEAGMIKKGQEIIIPAATFPAVASPILQNNCLPVYVDVESDSYNINPDEIEKAVNKKTGLIMPVHSFGNPADMKKIMEIAEQNNLPVIEDFCESHGAMIGNKKVGSFGTLSTLSFFVAHNMTSGEGGMIFTNKESLDSISKSLREFGRINTKERYPYVNEDLKRYDKRYVFERIGYNVRMSDVLASFGISQLEKLDKFNEIRRNNAEYYNKKLKQFDHIIQLPLEKPGTTHTYYGYVIVIKNSQISRQELVNFLEERKIETRPFMGGSLPDQPAFANQPMKIVGNLEVSKWIRDNAFFIGCHPLIDKQRINYVTESIKEFLENKE